MSIITDKCRQGKFPQSDEEQRPIDVNQRGKYWHTNKKAEQYNRILSLEMDPRTYGKVCMVAVAFQIKDKSI